MGNNETSALSPNLPSPAQRWSLYLIASAMLLTAAALIWVLADVEVFIPVLGIVAGIGLAGLWWPTPRVGAASPTDLTRAPQPFTALARVLAPLVLPLLVVIVAGTIESDWWVELVVGILAGLVAWGVALRHEMPGLMVIMPVIGEAGWGFWIAVGLIGIPAAVVAIAFAADGEIGRFEDKGGWSSALLLFAAYLWAAAALLRLIGFATSWLRLVEAAAIGAFLVRLVMAAGILPGHDSDLGDTLTVGVLAAIVAGVLMIEMAIGVWAVLERRVESITPIVTEKGALSLEGTRWLRALGTGTALVAALALGAAVVVGIEEATDEGPGRTTLAGAAIKAELPEQTTAALLPKDPKADEKRLVKTFQPVLAFREDQAWLPEPVREYIAESEMTGPDGPEPDPQTVSDLPQSCPGVVPSPCYRLTIGCPTANPCPAAEQPARPSPLPALQHPMKNGAVYTRVVRRDEAPSAFPSKVGTFDGEEPSILIQYWYFYPYDEWRTPILAGQLVQRHEADWEVVMVGLSDTRPLFVAYSQHCTGEWVPWDKVEVADTPPPRTRPLVAVARGSQANYPKADQQRSPDWGKCAGVPEGTVAVTSYASNIRDLTGYGFTWKPAEIQFVDGQSRLMTFPGYWGANGGAQLENARTFTLEQGGEPKTPSMQPQWTDPLVTALCDWRHPQNEPDVC
jgi:hypothetical protein